MADRILNPTHAGGYGQAGPALVDSGDLASPGIPHTPTAIEAIDLVKDYGRGDGAVHALRGVNIRFGKGRFTAIMGPSGSGKSTLMHTLAGLDGTTGGRIIFDGADITRLNDRQLTLLRRRQIGFIFQSFNLLPMFTAEQNIIMPLTLAGNKPDRAWFDMLVDTLGLRERLGHRPNELSGGQQQRVAIARALISKPSIVFADEPTGNLDSLSSAEVLSFLKQSVRELGQTVIMVTHDAVAASYADRAIVFADGRIVADQADPSAEAMSQLLVHEAEGAGNALRSGQALGAGSRTRHAQSPAHGLRAQG
ncbi:peptide ABC transporter ATP-binding protein [Bifidobacterium aemilianum]|uniref:Peptide ABC transporter ATP-binding protein n=1 Tax=Bifidobacterium aemilianum TaxID=2493120 RepID=A0A366KAL0_9BIFI|nr:ABC transporter ATP-binding protein [Bifidobacterium aemilianum]RBP98282.1 peptide ABC transporter ATP-binding protein [Bifidobacterium aemilianum]